jgi:uncharacterized repeat protein (TIGR01451 family)
MKSIFLHKKKENQAPESTCTSGISGRYFVLPLLMLLFSVGGLLAQSNVVIDKVSGPVSPSSGTTVTVSHQTGTQANRLMLVGISVRKRTVTGVTYGGTPLTLLTSQTSSSEALTYIYYMLAPPSGTANVVVTINSGASNDQRAIVGVTTFANVDVTNFLANANPATGVGNNTAPTVNVTSATGRLVFDVVAAKDKNISAIGAGQTQRWLLNNQKPAGAASTEPGAATTTMSYTLAASANWSISAVSIKEQNPAADLSITKTVNNPSPNIGANVTFTLTASNAGPSAASSVVVNDVLPNGYSLVSATPSTGTWTAPNWSIPSLGIGASATLTIVATVACGNNFTNPATISGAQPDPDGSNNTASASVNPQDNINTNIFRCFGQTVNLTVAPYVPCNVPGGTTVTWHTSTPATSMNKVADPTSVGGAPGVYNYYAAFEDAGNACYSFTTLFTVTIYPQLSITETITPISCYGGTGSISVVPSGGSGSGYTYAWSDGPSTSASRTGLPAGSYTVTLTDGNNCTAVETYELTQPPQLSAVGLTTNVSCNGGNNGAITQTVSGGTGLISYNWGMGQPTTKDRTGLMAGTYTVTISDANGCQLIRSYTITQPAVLSASASISQPTCGTAGVITLTVTGGTSPYTFDWADLPGISNPQNRSNLNFGNYSITITDSKGCVFNASYTLNDPMCPPGNPVCRENAADNFSVTPDPFVTSYNWTVPAGAMIVSGQGTSSIIVDWSAATLGPGQVCVVTENTCGESMPFCYPVIVKQVTASASAVSPCNGGDIQLSAGGGTQYQWSSPGGFSSSLQNPVIYNATGANSDTYTVTVTDQDGCVGTASVVVSVGVPPALSSVPTAATCGQSNGSINLTVMGGQMPYTFLWSNGATTEDLAGINAGNYTVTVTAGNGCTATLTTSVNDITGPSVATVPTNVSCFGGANGAVDTNVTGGSPPYVSYTWSNGATTPNLSGVSAGFYGVTVVDNTGCIGVSFADISQPNPLQVDIASTNITCNGASTGSINLTVSGGTPNYMYNWSGPGVTPGAQDQSGLAAGIYAVTVTDQNSCSQIFSITLTQPAALTLSTMKFDVSCFGGNNGAIDLTVSGGTGPYTYNWGDLTPPPAEPQDRTGLSFGTYAVTVTDANNCTASTSVMVMQPDQLTLSTSVTNASCFGSSTGAIGLTVMGGTGPFDYAWSNGATTEDIGTLAAGTYSVTVTDDNGCQASTMATVGEPAALVLSSVNTNLSCFGGTDGAINLSVTGGTGSYTYDWADLMPPPAEPEDRTGLAAGQYSVTVMDANNCTATLQVSLTSPTQLQASAFIEPASCFGGNNGAISLNVTGGTVGYTYAWSNGLPSQKEQMGLAANTYTVTITDGNGCELIQSHTVTQPPQLSVPGVTTDVTCNGAGNGSINLAPTGGVAPYTFAWSNGAGMEDISGLAPGVYTVTVTDFNLCTATNSFTVNEPAVLQVSGVAVTNCPSQSNGSITLTVTGGNTSYSFNWSDIGSGPQNRTLLGAGTYSVTVTDSKNCTATASFTLTPLSVELAKTDRNCLAPTGQAFATASGGVTPYMYNWTGPGPFTSTDQNISNLDVGTYFVTVTDGNNCQVTGNITVGSPNCQPPVAVDDTYTTPINTPLTQTVATNDSDPQYPNSELEFIPLTFIDPITEGMIEFDPDFLGGFTFTPVMGFVGTVSIQYQVCNPLDLCDVATLTITVLGTPTWTLTKVANQTSYNAVNNVLTYNLVLTNTGQTPISTVSVADPTADAAPLRGPDQVGNNDNTLDVGEIWTYTAQRTITQANLDAGQYTNTATASGTPLFANGPLPDATAVETVQAVQTPGIAVIKTASVGGTGAVNDVITYTFTVTNTGNVTLSGVKIDDALTGSVNLAVTPSTLAPGATGTATATYTIQQSDINLGYVENQATATGSYTDGNGDPQTTDDLSDDNSNLENDPTVTPLTQTPGIAVIKTASVGGTGAVNDVITYTFTVTNTGNVR